MKILVADDEATSRKTLSVSLARLGHVVDVVEDGAQAWDRLAGDDLPELVILDWHMPGLDGPEICRKLRQHKTQRYVYVIAAGGSRAGVHTRSAPARVEPGQWGHTR